MSNGAAQFGRLERRGVLLGLTGWQLGLIGGAMFVAVAAVRGAGGVGLALAAPLWLMLLVAGFVTVGGRSIPAWTPVTTGWLRAKASGHTRAASRPQTTPGVLQLPGLAGSLELVPSDRLSGVLVVDRRAATVVAVARVRASGFLLDDDATQEHKVAAWGRVLGGLCQQAAVLRVQVITTITAGGAAPARRWWREHCLTANAGPAAVLADLLDEDFARATRREHLVAIAVRSPQGHRRLTAAVADAIAGVFAGVGDSLGAAELTVDGWLGEQDLARSVRRAYDPHTSVDDIDVHAPTPVGVAERWDRWQTGTIWHATYWVAEWPRTSVDPAFLQPLTTGDTGVRVVSLTAEPVPAREALRQIRRARAEYRADAAQRQRIGQVEDRSVQAEVEALDRREAELVAGHGDLRFTGLVSVSAPDPEALASACREIEADAARAMCDLVRLVGQQGAAHLAAALPLARSIR